jgi:Fe-S oxidoreductase
MVSVPQRSMSYAGVFDNVRILGEVLALDKFSWMSEVPPGAAMPFVLHLSCMAHYTPHIPYLAQKIMQKIGLDCPILGGPENCCGALHHHLGDDKFAAQTAQIGIAGFKRARPTTVLSICPDCDETFARFMPAERPFHHSNLSELFVEQLERIKPMMQPINKNIVLHVHDHNDARVRDARNVKKLLQAIPGIQILSAKNNAGPGPHCQFLAPMPKEDQQAMFAEAAALGATTLVVPYHSCYRQHLKMELRYTVKVEHYLSVLAASLQITAREEYKRLRLLDDLDKTVEEVRPRFHELGYSTDQIRSLVKFALYNDGANT